MTGELRVVYLDETLAVVDKPAGLVVHPAPSHRGPTLVDEMGEILGGGGPAAPRHRPPTRQGHKRPARRRPHRRGARARSRPRCSAARSSAATWRWPAADSRLAPGRSMRRLAAPRASDTGWPSQAPPPGRRAPTSRCWSCSPRRPTWRSRLETGRTHQIRAHFAAIGHPLTGDMTYGGAARYGLERQFLHAHRLAFTHPAERRGARL